MILTTKRGEEGHQIYEKKKKNCSPLLYTYPSSFKIATY